MKSDTEAQEKHDDDDDDDDNDDEDDDDDGVGMQIAMMMSKIVWCQLSNKDSVQKRSKTALRLHQGG